jgi:uncharacterized protein
MALGFLADVAAGRYEEAFARLADTARFEIVAPPPVGGVHDRKGIEAVAAKYIHSMCAQPLQPKVIAITVEGERAAIEAHGYAPLIDGSRYENRYHYLFVVRNGKIEQIREYLDSAYLEQTIRRIAEFRARNEMGRKEAPHAADSSSSER